MGLTKSFLTIAFYDRSKLLCGYMRKGEKVCECWAVWSWSYKPIYMLVFSKYVLWNIFHLNDSIDIKTVAIKHNF